MPAFCASATSFRRSLSATRSLARGLDQRQVVGADDPQRSAHREVFRQRAALVEVGVQIGDGETGQPCPQRQVRSGRIGGVQTDDTCSNVRRGLSVRGRGSDAARAGPAARQP